MTSSLHNYPGTLRSFTLGSVTTSVPLVDVSNIKGHLALLNKFVQLKKWVEQAVITMPYVPRDKEQKWAWFVGMAVERVQRPNVSFDKWCRALLMSDSGRPTLVVLPPIDVIMVWHSYMLNPRWYAEDCMRLPACQALKMFEHHFTKILQDDPFSALLAQPSRERVEFWASRTNLGWDPLVKGGYSTHTYISCPRCDHYIKADYMKKNGTGYLQDNFMVLCPRKDCMISTINRETLALGKLARDLAADGFTTDPGASHLAGTYFTVHPQDIEKGDKIKRTIRKNAEAASRANASHPNETHRRTIDNHLLNVVIVEKYANSLEILKRDMAASVTRAPYLIDRIISAYNDDKPYSVELVGAVLRQGSFVRKMFDLEWTAPGLFDDSNDELVLYHALARYHAFLNLITSSPNPNTCHVPTLDIDLVWHTHQLMPGNYRVDCEQYLGRFLDHNDKISSTILTTAFKQTSRAWKEKYHVQYTHCGCPVPGSTIGQRLSRIVRGYLSKSPQLQVDLSVPSEINRPEILSATHQSDHNAVHHDGDSLRNNQKIIEHECLMTQMERHKSDDPKERETNRSAPNSEQARGSRPPTTQQAVDMERVDYSRGREEIDASRFLLIPIPVYANDTRSHVNGGRSSGTTNRGASGSNAPSNRKKQSGGCAEADGGCDEGDGDGGGDCGDGGCGGCGGCG